MWLSQKQALKERKTLLQHPSKVSFRGITETVKKMDIDSSKNFIEIILKVV